MENINKNFEDVKLEHIKQFVDIELEKNGLYNKIKTIIDENLEDDEEKLMNKIKELGLIDEILENFKNNGIEKAVDNSKKCIYIKLIQARGFIDYINVENSFFIFDILFLGQRTYSKKIPCSSDFHIDQSFIFEFNPLKLDVDIDLEKIKRLSCPIHIIITLNSTDCVKLVGCKSLEWRWALCYGSWKIETEIFSPITTNKLNVGTLDIQVSLLPAIEKSRLLSEKNVFDHLNGEKKYETECAQEFIKYANDWWEDYKNIRNSHSNRIIKLFLPTEDRENYVYKPANSLIEPLSLGRGINTPYEAARFVSLLPFKRNENPGGEKVEIWQSVHTFLALGSGDVENHSLLLCNLLLGFGLDAYIAVGMSINGPHIWVLTRAKVDKKYVVTYWESLTGQRVAVEDSKVFRFYKRIHSVFNDNKFYANIQVDDTVFNTIYTFEDEFLWKGIPSDKITPLPKYSFVPMLDIIITDHYKIELEIEREIKTKIVKFRKSMDMKTNWDGRLSFLISPALVNYEHERISSQTYGNEEFKQSVKNYVPEGYTFKGFPLHTVEIDYDKIFGLILSSDVGKDVLYTRGDNATFALRCKIFPYPQGINSIWIMIAVKYRPIR